MSDQAPASDIATPPKKRGMGLFVPLFLLGFVTFKWSFIFFVVGMFPTFIAYLVDHDKHRYTFYTVAALNFSGVFPDMMALYLQGGSFSAAMDRLSDFNVWLIMYSAAALGWATVWLAPIMTSHILEGVYRGRIGHMENSQKKLESEWGAEINRRAGKE